jgi:phospholipid N-methyltransferase
VFTGLLPSNERPSIVGCGLVGTCLPIRLLATAQSVTMIYIFLDTVTFNRALVKYMFGALNHKVKIYGFLSGRVLSFCPLTFTTVSF